MRLFLYEKCCIARIDIDKYDKLVVGREHSYFKNVSIARLHRWHK